MGGAIVAPGKSRIHDRPEGGEGSAIPLVTGEVLGGVANAIGEHGVRPVRCSDNRFSVRINENLVRIEPMPLLRSVGTMNTESVELVGLDVRDVAVPDHVGQFGERETDRLALRAHGVEQTEFDFRRVLGKQGEVCSSTVPGRSQRKRLPRPDQSHFVASLR